MERVNSGMGRRRIHPGKKDMIASWLGMDDKHFVTGRVTQDRDPAGEGYIEVTITAAADERKGAA